MGNLFLPAHLGLSVDLSSRLKLLALLTEKDGSGNDSIISHDGLVVVHVGGAARAVVAVYCFACWRRKLAVKFDLVTAEGKRSG